MRLLLATCLYILPAAAQGSALNSCDLNADGAVDRLDMNLVVSMALGMTPCKANIAGFAVCNAVTVQRVVNAALAGVCTMSDGSHSVQLTWTASASTGVTGYNVFRALASGGPYTQATTTPVAGTAYLDTMVKPGITYYYVLTAVDANNNSSAYSTEASAVIPPLLTAAR